LPSTSEFRNSAKDENNSVQEEFPGFKDNLGTVGGKKFKYKG
jgi:hypothetical protein